MSMAVCTCNYQGTLHEIPFELNVRQISFSSGTIFLVLILLCDLRKECGCPNFLTSFGPKKYQKIAELPVMPFVNFPPGGSILSCLQVTLSPFTTDIYRHWQAVKAKGTAIAMLAYTGH
jgi:hypothetical protein